MTSLKRSLLLLMGVVLLCGCGPMGTTDPPADYAGSGTEAVVVEVKEGDTSSRIGEALLEAGVVASSEAFVQAARLEPEALSIQPGFYDLKKEMSSTSALKMMLDPVALSRSRLIVPEGLTQTQTLDLLAERTGTDREALQAAASDPAVVGVALPGATSLEGMLAPGSYDIAPGSDAASILTKMVERFNTETLPLLLQSPDPYETLKKASIVQEEAGTMDEFGQVARVVENRLEVDMLLQMDSTVNYTRTDQRLHLSEDDVQQDTPYNTYTNKGLPPTPIASPSLQAVQAVLDPPPGDWLYFVAVGPRTSFFTADYQEFLDAKQDAQDRGVY